MIKVTKISGEEFILNEDRLQTIELIPESKVVMADGTFYLLKETAQEIIDKAIAYKAKILALEKTVLFDTQNQNKTVVKK